MKVRDCTIGFGAGGVGVTAGGASSSTSSAMSIGMPTGAQPEPSAIAATRPAWINTDAVTGTRVLHAMRFTISSAVRASSVSELCGFRPRPARP